VPRYKLTIAYDGTEFHGWQKQEPKAALALGLEVEPGEQKDAAAQDVWDGGPKLAGSPRVLERLDDGRVILRTVQEVVERAVREVVREPVDLVGASRTDAGVHAWGQVGAFSCGEGQREEGTEGQRGDGGWPVERGVERLVMAVNARLPEDVLVRTAEVVEEGFDPISHCVSKGYSYTMHVARSRPLWDRRYVTHLWTPLDVEAMRAAASRLVGTHDFAAFAAAGHGRQSTVRTIHACEVRAERVEGALPPRPTRGARAEGGEFEAQRLRVDVSGDGFLYNMVRIIAGTLVEVGKGKLAPGSMDEIIASGDRTRAGSTLPPEGLRLEWIKYTTHG